MGWRMRLCHFACGGSNRVIDGSRRLIRRIFNGVAISA
jgi:hypothetical protein